MSKNKHENLFWTLKISVLAFVLSILFSISSEIILDGVGIGISILLIVVFMLANVFVDMIGLAITTCQINDIDKINVDEKKKNTCLSLIKNADKVSSILSDVIGDICGILSGAGGATITIILTESITYPSLTLLVGALVSSLIACITVLLKSISKAYAIKHSIKIVLVISGFLSIFSKNLS